MPVKTRRDSFIPMDAKSASALRQWQSRGNSPHDVTLPLAPLANRLILLPNNQGPRALSSVLSLLLLLLLGLSGLLVARPTWQGKTFDARTAHVENVTPLSTEASALTKTKPIGIEVQKQPTMVGSPATPSVPSVAATPEKSHTTDGVITERLTTNTSLEAPRSSATAVRAQRQPPTEMMQAMAIYRQALQKLQLSPTGRSEARDFYLSAVSLVEAVGRDQDLVTWLQASLQGLWQDEQLFQLVSRSSAGWMRWQHRNSDAIVVTGTVTHVAADGRDIRVRIMDRAASKLSVRLLDGLTPSIGDRIIVVGRIDDSTGTSTVTGGICVPPDQQPPKWARHVVAVRRDTPG